MSITSSILEIKKGLPQGVKLVAVSKFHPAECILEAYNAGQRMFGESRPQEFAPKVASLPSDIQWHFIGHLQTNKLRIVLPYAFMVESVDSVHLLDAIAQWGRVNERKINVLLELHLGAEQTKHGLSEDEIFSILSRTSDYDSVCFCGLMGMATNTDDEAVIRADFGRISSIFRTIKSQYPVLEDFTELSIGMSADYLIAIEYGATIVRVGTAIFGERQL